MSIILATFYALLPAFAANMAPVIAARLHFLPRLALPIDGGLKLHGEYLFGANKTWRGLIVGAFTAMFVGALQYFLWQFHVVRINSIIDFSIIEPLSLGFFGGLGALIGDLAKSFVKRRFRIPPGNPWPIFDQLDFIIGYFLATAIFVQWDLQIVITAFLMTLVLHPLTNITAYFLRIKKVWW